MESDDLKTEESICRAKLAWISMELSIPNIMFRKSAAGADLSFL